MASFAIARSSTATKNVPDDVWRLIFCQVVDEVCDHNTDNMPTTTKPLKLAIKLSHVSVRFRRVVTQQTELWNKIPVTITIDGDSRALFLDEELVVIALARASQLPLVLSLRVDEDGQKSRTCMPRPGIIGVLTFLKCIRRARALSIDHTAIGVCGQYLNLIQTLSADGAPFLEELSYYGPPSEIKGSIVEIISKFSKKSIHLKTLKIFREQGVYASWTGFRFTFDNLLNLEIGGPITFRAIYSILSSTKSLLACVIHELWDQEKPDLVLGINPISLPLLAKLCIRGSRPVPYDTVSCILALITAPSLKILRLTECEWRPSNILHFVRKTTFMLRQMSLEGVKISSSEIIDVLESLPSLELLAFDLFFLQEDNNIFARRMMAWDADSQAYYLCPELRILHIFYTCKNGHSLSAPSISDMIDKRMRSCEGVFPPLKEVRIFSLNPCRFVSFTSIEITRLLSLKHEGLNIHFEPDCR